MQGITKTEFNSYFHEDMSEKNNGEHFFEGTLSSFLKEV